MLLKAIAISLILVSCGTGIDRVEGIKGQKGDAGINGSNGKDGKDAVQPPMPPTVPINSSIHIVVNGNAPICPSNDCPEPMTVICACVAQKWKTIMVDKRDISKYKVKNLGECQSKQQQFKALCGRPIYTPAQQETPEC